MSSVSLPVTRPAGRALVVGHPASRGQPLEMLRQMGFTCAEADEPYAAMGELCRGPAEYKAVVLSLAGVYTEELELIAAIKQRHPGVEVWLTDADGRQSALAEAVRLGADGVADEDGLHRVALTPAAERRTRGATSAAGLAAELSQVTGTAAAYGDGVAGAPAAGDCEGAGAIGTGAPQEGAPAPPHYVGQPRSAGRDATSIDREADSEESAGGDPVLTADELRALLHEPAAPSHATRSEP
jgi:hypothetical protein